MDPRHLNQFGRRTERMFERLETLERSAQLMAAGCYENFVLTVYKGLREPAPGRFLRDLVNEAPGLPWDLIKGDPESDPAAEILEATIAAARDAPAGVPAEDDIQARLRQFAAARGLDPIPLDAYVDSLVEPRQGYPEHGPVHWLQEHERARILVENVRQGVYADYIEVNRVPPEFQRGLANAALAVERGKVALDHAKRAVKDAQTKVENLDPRRTPGLSPKQRAEARKQAQRWRDHALNRAERISTGVSQEVDRFARSLGPRPPGPSSRGPSTGRGR